MSIAKKIYRIGKTIKEILSSKTLKVYTVAVGTIVLFFGVFNAYAADSADLYVDWDGIQKSCNELSLADSEEVNITSTGCTNLGNTLWSGIIHFLPQASKGYNTLLEDDSVSDFSKLGLIGMLDQGSDLAYAYYPSVDIPTHLAQQWVPGYNESVTSTYAANSATGHPSGYQELVNSGVVNLWNKTLNIAYICFVIVMLVAGFMIMFRHKLGGQAVVTLGNVLPNIIIALILATFSFAIVGFIIDIGGIANVLVANVIGIGELGSIGDLGQMVRSTFGSNNISTFTTWGSAGTLGLVGSIITFSIGAFTTLPLTLGIIGGLSIVAMVFFLGILGIVFFGAIQVFIALIKAYFSLLLNVILGPIQIAMGAIPGNSYMITNWLLSVLRNVLVFPTVLFIVNIPNALVNENTSVIFGMPGKLIYGDPANPGGLLDSNVASAIFMFILKIFVLYYAAQAPKFLEAIFPPNTPKPVAEGMQLAQANLSKVPLVGGLFK